MTMSLATGREFASQAGRGGLSALGSLLRELIDDTVRTISVAGSGFLSGTGTLCKWTVKRRGDIIHTSILVDLTGAASEATLADIIGDDGAANCHLGQIRADINGTILGGFITCLEAPATGEVDIDFFSANESTGVEGADVTALTQTELLATAADWTIDLVRALAKIPPANDYLYLAVGTVTTPTAGVYTAGKFLIELFGYDA